jgi:hypothetical protein
MVGSAGVEPATGRLYNAGMPALPSFIHSQHAAGTGATRSRGGWRGTTVVAGLALLLVLQVLVADRERLAADARWRPLVAATCTVLRCEVPAWREPAALTLVRRDVRPARAGVLHVAASFRNDARWPQAWPTLLLTLSDVDGRAVGFRAFTPSEYLGAAPASPALGSGATADVAMDIVEPADGVVAFTFDFR